MAQVLGTGCEIPDWGMIDRMKSPDSARPATARIGCALVVRRR